MQSLKISVSGVRGIVGDTLTPYLLARFSQAFGTYINSGKVVVGSDTRTSREMIKNAIFSGLISSGCQVIDLGIVPIPTVQVMVRELNCKGGIGITASHNPAEWNALKFLRSDGIYLNQYEGEELLDIYHQGDFTKTESTKYKKVIFDKSAVERHIKKVLDNVDVGLIKQKKFNVAADMVNGAGCVMTEKLLKKLGCEIFPINNIPDGIFPHNPEPVGDNLNQIKEFMKNKDYDIGFVQDADADRLAILDNNGEPIGEDLTLALASKFVLKNTDSNVVTNLSTSMVIDYISNLYDKKTIRTKIGEVNVVEGILSENAAIGGEGNGGVIYPAVNPGRDSFIGMGLILQLLAEEDRKLSEIVGELPKYYIVKDKITIPSNKIMDIILTLKHEYINNNLDLQDGIKIIHDNHWIHIRPSNTEPILRIIAEADDKKFSHELVESFKKKINDMI